MGMFGSKPNVYRANRRTQLYPGEENYFRQHPEVGGMAAQDNNVILNPYSTLSDQEKEAVYRNEAARLYMRARGTPQFELTPDQARFLDSNTYANASPDDRRATIIARALSGDPSAGQLSPEQQRAVEEMRGQLGWGQQRAPNALRAPPPINALINLFRR